jgi:cupin superfamily acireductone dioxygenase involved in methionine salvage
MLSNYDNLDGIGSIYNTKSHKWTGQDLYERLKEHDNIITKFEKIIEELSKLNGLESRQIIALNGIK